MTYTIFWTLLGVALLLFVAYDVYATILHARMRPGPITDRLNRTVWWGATTLAWRLSRKRRHWLLNGLGPLMMPILIALLIFLLVLGFAMIYYPHMPTEFTIDGSSNHPFLDALYFSGVTLVTVGYGDITPHTNLMRVVALLQGASGIGVISLAVTYLLTVYGALERERAVALSVYHQSRRGADVASFITHHFVRERFIGFDDAVFNASRDIQTLLESHTEHPVINYFHALEVYKSLPRALFVLLETSTVIHSCLDREAYADLTDHPEVRTLNDSALHVIDELAASLGLKHDSVHGSQTDQETRLRQERTFRRAVKTLEDAGIKLCYDRREALAEYLQRRQAWEPQLQLFAHYLGYDWEEISGDNDLEYAANEELNEPVLEAS